MNLTPIPKRYRFCDGIKFIKCSVFFSILLFPQKHDAKWFYYGNMIMLLHRLLAVCQKKIIPLPGLEITVHYESDCLSPGKKILCYYVLVNPIQPLLYRIG